LFATQKNTTEKHEVNPRPLFVRVVKTKSEINMKWLTIEDIKKQLRIDYSYEDDVLDLYGSSAEDTVLNYLNRSYQELLETYGEVPAPIRQATLMLVDNSYQHRTPAEPTNMYYVLYGFDNLVKPYMRLSGGIGSCHRIATYTVGSQIKIQVGGIMPDGTPEFADIDFSLEVYNDDAKDKKVAFTKDECVMTTKGYAVLVDSDKLGIGTYMLKLTKMVPDEDFPDGVRKDVHRVNPNVKVTG